MEAVVPEADEDKPKRTPRWAILKPFDIYAKDGSGDVYLHRFRLIQTPLFAIYIHDLNLPDTDRHPHDHPWTFWSFVLRGGYTETVYCDDTRTFHPNGVRYDRRWNRWSWHRMNITDAHMIRSVQPNTKTLVITGRRRREFDFWTEDGPVVWTDYIKAGDTSDHPKKG